MSQRRETLIPLPNQALHRMAAPQRHLRTRSSPRAAIGDLWTFGNMKRRQKVWMAVTFLAVVTGLLTIVTVYARRGFRALEELTIKESVKGGWQVLQGFRRDQGRYPLDGAELFGTDELGSLLQYTPPVDDSADEAVLWWSEESRFGAIFGITEAGIIVRQNAELGAAPEPPSAAPVRRESEAMNAKPQSEAPAADGGR